MIDQNIDYVGALQEHYDLCDVCWDKKGFWPTRKSEFQKTPIVVFGASLCYQFFVTNGLQGLFDCEYGKMFPEFIICCRYMRCSETEQLCNEIVTTFFDGKFERDDLRRSGIVGGISASALLHGQYSERLENSLETDEFSHKLESYCKYQVKRIGALVKKVDFRTTENSTNIWPDSFWTREIDKE